MFEPEELMARIVDLEEQLIACLEGEIAKRDARIVELENELSDIDFARRVSLQNESDLAETLNLLRAELAALKAQEPVAWVGAIEGGVPLLMVEPQNWKATPLYAAPVSEAKAQGVVQWPEADEIMQMAFEEGHPADDASGYYFELEEFDLFIDRLMSEVAILNAAPVQQVSVPDVSSMARILADRNADACNVNREDNWAIYGQDYIDDVKAMLAAAPAAGSHKEQK